MSDTTTIGAKALFNDVKDILCTSPAYMYEDQLCYATVMAMTDIVRLDPAHQNNRKLYSVLAAQVDCAPTKPWSKPAPELQFHINADSYTRQINKLKTRVGITPTAPDNYDATIVKLYKDAKLIAPNANTTAQDLYKEFHPATRFVPTRARLKHTLR